MRRANNIAMLLAAAGLLAGACLQPYHAQPKTIDSYLAEPADLENVRRIMVLPFTQQAGMNADCEQIRDALLSELMKLRRFEVVPLPSSAAENRVLNASLRRGRPSTDAMVRLCDRYALDGVLVGSITSWRPYKPAHLGMRTQLISIHSGSTVWAVDAIYDANDRTTIADLRDYADRHQADDGSLHGWELNLMSPNRFVNYVAHRFVGTWVED